MKVFGFMIRGSYACVKYARNVSKSNFTALDLVQECNDNSLWGISLEDLSSQTGILVPRLKKFFNYLAIPNEKEFSSLLSVRNRYVS
jgi:hypothetical protein